MNGIQKLKKIATAAIDNVSKELYDLSQEIWKNPELAYEEKFAHNLLTEYLEKKNFNVEKHYVLDTAFNATFEQAAKPHIVVLSEYDALPEIGHACGHNLIAELGVGAGIGIRAAMEASKVPLGKLSIFGAPAEEAEGGKIDLINGGAFKDVDAAMMCHPSSFSSSRTRIIACMELKVVFKGRASHAAAFPSDGINALDAAVLGYNNISCLRQQLKPNSQVHGIITNGGAKPNIIPEEAELYYYLRALTMGDLNILKDKVQGCIDGAAAATGCTVEYQWDPRPFANLMPNKTIEELYRRNAQSIGIEFSSDPNIQDTTTGSTDMGNVSHVVPALHPHYDIGTKHFAHTRPFEAEAGTQEAHEATIKQAKALAMTAIDLMSDETLLKQAKADFEEDVKRDLK